MTPTPLNAAAGLEEALAYDESSLPAGKIYFEVPIDPSLPGPLRQKLSLAAYAKIQEIDPEGQRGEWMSLPHVPNDPAKMPAFIRTRCLYPLGPQSRVQDCLVTQDDPPATTYCYDDEFRVCYHPFLLVNPDTGLPMEVHASDNGVEGSAKIQLVLAWMSDPIFPAGSTFTAQALARFEAHEAVTDDDAVTGWPDSFQGRVAAPANDASAGRLRRTGSKCWIDFQADEVLTCDLGSGLAGDYTLMMILCPSDGAGKCEVFRSGTDAAGVTVTMERDDAKWILSATHAGADGSLTLPVELPASGQYRVLTLQFSREEGLCVFVDDERIPRRAEFAPTAATGASGETRIGCHTQAGAPGVSVGELLLFREPVWEETRRAVARYLKINYAG